VAQALPYVRLAAKSDHLRSLQSTISVFFPLKIVWKFLCEAATNLKNEIAEMERRLTGNIVTRKFR